MAGGVLLLASALAWWRVQRRIPAVISAAIAVAGLAASSGRRWTRLVVVGAAGAVLATAAVLGLGPVLGLAGVFGAVAAGGALVGLVVRLGEP